MDKAQIILEIQRTASDNGGTPLGLGRFTRETGISMGSWRGKYWRNWSHALQEAEFAANRPKEAHEQSFLVLSLARLTQKNRRFPTYADMRLEKETDKSFPSHHSLSRLGTLNERIKLVRTYAKEPPEYGDVLEALPKSQGPDDEELPDGHEGSEWFILSREDVQAFKKRKFM
jgi:hypothetical protein